MSDIIYPAGIILDPVIQQRTKEFFVGVWQDKITDTELATWVGKGMYLEARNKEGKTPLGEAAAYGKTAAVEALLAAGAEIEARDNKGSTPLINTATLHGIEAAKKLLAAGANIEARGNGGQTVMMNAAGNVWLAGTSTVEAVSTLLARGANFYARSVKNGTVADYILNASDKLALQSVFDALEEQYQQFLASGKAPASAQETYRLLSAVPLADAGAPVDYAGNLHRIFTYAKWENKQQAEDILKEMQKDRSINAATCESILAATFPPEHIRHRSQPRLVGVAI